MPIAYFPLKLYFCSIKNITIMKRLYLIITALFALASYAQEPLTKIVDKTGVAAYDYCTFLKGMGDEYYVCTDYTMLNSFTRVAQDIITCVSKNGTKGRKIVVERSMDLNLIAIYEGESQIHCLYNMYDNSTKSYVLYLNSVSKKATTSTWNPKKIISFKLERREDVLMGSAVSPDQTKASIVIFQVNKAGFFQSDQTDKLKGSGVMAFGDEGLLWTKPLELDFPNSTINIFDISVHNNSNTYVAISSYNTSKSSDKTKENETLHLFEVSAEETRMAEIQPDFGSLLNGKLLLCSSGDIAIGGYYQKNIKQKASGAYIATFDGKTMENGSFSTQSFPQTYYEYKHSKFSKKGEDFDAVAVDFKEFSNGTKVLLGEARVEVQSYPYTYTLFGNTLISFADKNNQLDEFQMIYKNQSIINSNKSTKYYQSVLLCFNTIMHNDQLYLFFNDNLSNHTGKSGQLFDVANTNYKKKCGLYCTLDGDRHVSDPVMFMNYQNYKTVIYRPLVIDKGGLLIYNSSGMYGAVSKLKRQF